MSRVPLPLLLAALAALAPAAVSTFDTDDEGWRIADFDFATATATLYDPSVVRPSFLPGGWITTGDEAPWCFLAAPAKFLGDASSALGTDLTYDTFVDENDGERYPAVVLQGAGMTAFHVSNPPGVDWTAVSIPLVGSSWSTAMDGSGAALTDAQLEALLGNLTGLFIEADWTALSLTETTGLDNVRLRTAPVPEPASLAAVALAAFAVRRRRR